MGPRSEKRERVVMCRAEDVDLPRIKAMAAEWGLSVTTNPYCPPGKALVIDPNALDFTRGDG